MRRVRISLTLLIACLAAGLLTWALVNQQLGYATAATLLFASAVYALVRGPGLSCRLQHDDQWQPAPPSAVRATAAA